MTGRGGSEARLHRTCRRRRGTYELDPAAARRSAAAPRRAAAPGRAAASSRLRLRIRWWPGGDRRQGHGALVCGIVGLLLCGVDPRSGRHLPRHAGQEGDPQSGGRLKGEGLATAGIVMGIIALVTFVLSIILLAAA